MYPYEDWECDVRYSEKYLEISGKIYSVQYHLPKGACDDCAHAPPWEHFVGMQLPLKFKGNTCPLSEKRFTSTSFVIPMPQRFELASMQV